MEDKLEILKDIIEGDCTIKKYPNRNYCDYDKGREAGYNWVLKEIDKLQKNKR